MIQCNFSMNKDPESWIKTKKWKCDDFHDAEVKIIKNFSDR